jgi:hypothetical protein
MFANLTPNACYAIFAIIGSQLVPIIICRPCRSGCNIEPHARKLLDHQLRFPTNWSLRQAPGQFSFSYFILCANFWTINRSLNADDVPPRSGQSELTSIHAGTSRQSPQQICNPSAAPASKSGGTPGSPSSSFKDLTPTNFPPVHESRRRNAEQRAATLKADTLIGSVEPNRVFCSLCKKWVQLRQDSSYCAYPWLQHRGKCLARQ